MKPTPKADECIRMISKVEELNFIFNIKKEPITDEVISRWGTNKDRFMKLDREQFDSLLYWSKYYSMITTYRLLPFAQINYKGNGSFKQYNGTPILQDLSTFLDKHNPDTDKKILWQVLTEYDEVMADDLKKEFWDIIPDLASVQDYYGAMRMKYKDVFSKIPDKDYWNYFKLIKDDSFMAYYNSLIKYGIATQNEVEILVLKICNVVERLDIVCNSILDVYKSFFETTNKTTDKNQQPPHFNGDFTDDELTTTFEKLKQGKYIHSESDLDSWIYLCTGREGKTLKKPINWMKAATLLGMFVQDLFNLTDKDRIWEITAKCFTVKGKTPNTNSIKVALSKIKQDWKDRPIGYDKMKNEIIKDIT